MNLVMRKNLIMGAAINYDYKDIEPFFVTLYNVIKNCDCVMFVRDNPDGTIEKLQGLGVKTIELPSKEVENNPIETMRWKYFQKYLLDNKSQYENVFITDVRDVMFQADLFERYKQYDNYIVFALESMLICEEPVNTNWLKRDFGDDVYNSISQNNIICGGSICGSVSAIIELADVINSIQETHEQLRGLDQAALNYIVWGGQYLKDIKVLTSDADGIIATIGFEKLTGKVHDGKIYVNNNIPAVVHQYDRDIYLLGHVLLNYTSRNKLLLYLQWGKPTLDIITAKKALYLQYRGMMKPIEAKFKTLFK